MDLHGILTHRVCSFTPYLKVRKKKKFYMVDANTLVISELYGQKSL